MTICDEPSIPAMVLAAAEAYGDSPAVVDGDVSLTFRDVADEMMRCARAMVASGVQAGDRVALWAPNSISWTPAALAIQAAGAWLVPLNTRLRGEEAAYILAKTGAVLLLAVDSFLGTDYEEMLRVAAPDLAVLGSVVRLPGPGVMRTPAWDAFRERGSAIEPAEIHRRVEAIGPEDVCDIIFTSGTTGLPKGVMLRHGASLKGYSIYNGGYGLGAGDKHMVATPFFHCFGYKAGWMLSLMAGATTYPVAVFDGATALALIESAGITHMPAAPTMFSAILDDPNRDRFDLTSLRTTLIAAANVPEQLVHRVRDEIGIGSVLTGYGLTENHALVSVSSADDAPERIASTVGRVFDELEVRVVDADGTDVAPGEPGELWVRGFLVMTGYYADEAASAEAVVDGWLRTGDVVVLSPDRYLRITDRLKDIYIMGGFNVAPAEVEHALLDMPGVSQVAVVGVPDEHFGEVGAAFVIAGGDVTADDVVTYARAHLANYKVPRHVRLVEAFPLNATGKVLKHELRAQLDTTSGS